MLHRLKQVSRLVCAALGVCLLLWLPLSYFFFLAGGFPVPGMVGANFSSVSGVAQLMIIKSVPADSPLLPYTAGFSCSRVSDVRASFPPSKATEMTLKPAPFQLDRLVAYGGSYVSFTAALPIWLIAMGLLLWPGLSLYLHWKRKRRVGFPVGQPAST